MEVNLQAAQASEAETKWTRVITSHVPYFSLPWRELWLYRDLIILLFKRDFVATYKQTILGPLWYVIQPLLTTLVFTAISRVAEISTNGIPDFLFYMSGVTVWNYFQDCVLKTSRTFSANKRLFGKVYFPRLTVPISILLTNFVAFCIQFAFFLCFYFYFYSQGAPINPSWRVIIIPFIIIQLALLGLGLGCLANSIATRYQDLATLINFGMQLWMYVTIVIPLSKVPEEWRGIFILNPMSPILEGFRFAIFGVGIIEVWQFVLSCVVSLIIFLFGVMSFNFSSKTVVDTI